MTQKEFATIAMAIKTCYPKEKLLDTKQAADLWYEQLADIPYNIAEMALKKWISTNKWSPTIADIRELSASVSNGDMPDWGNGWEQVLKAIRCYGIYRPEEALASMDELTRTCVRRLGFQNICLSENIASDRANFRLIYEELAKRQKMDSQIPAALKQAIEQTREKQLLIE